MTVQLIYVANGRTVHRHEGVRAPLPRPGDRHRSHGSTGSHRPAPAPAIATTSARPSGSLDSGFTYTNHFADTLGDEGLPRISKD